LGLTHPWVAHHDPHVARPVRPTTPLRERLAALEHEQWAHSTGYLLDHLTPENVERWRRQINTPYEQLSEPEKQSDREWADRVLELIRASAALGHTGT
jgi:hypothetical protein